MTCPACGRANEQDKRFCTACGTSLSASLAPRLFVHSGSERGRSFHLREGRLVVGRGRDTDIVLTDPLVSSRHFAITWSAGTTTIEDLKSANGTVVAGETLSPGTPRMVAAGSMIQIGDSILELVAPGAEPLPAPPTITRTSRGSTSRFRRRTVLTVGAVAAVSLVALVIGIAALSRDSAPPPAAAPSAGGAGHDAAWVMRTQSHTTVEVGACDSSSRARCDATGQGGTGSVISLDEGLILTNFHVIAGDALTDPLPNLLTVVSVTGQDWVETEVVGYSACDDLALLRIVGDAAPLDLAEIELGDTSSLEVGDQVVVLGYPGAVATAQTGDPQLQLTAGNVSALSVMVDNYRDLIQISAPINHGNSGGPVFDLDGRQIGVATLGDREGTQGIFYAISVDRVNEILADLRSGSQQRGLDGCPA